MTSETAAVVHLAAESRDSYLTLRRVERQQRLVELLGAVQDPVSSAVLARQLGVGLRTWNEISPGCESRACLLSRYLVLTAAADCHGTPRQIQWRSPSKKSRP